MSRKSSLNPLNDASRSLDSHFEVIFKVLNKKSKSQGVSEGGIVALTHFARLSACVGDRVCETNGARAKKGETNGSGVTR